MSTRRRVRRRDFLRGMAGVAGLGAAGIVAASCRPQPTVEAPTGIPVVGEATATSGAQPTAAPAIKYADKPCVFRYLAQANPLAPDDPLVEGIMEEAVRNSYGLNVDYEWECAADYSVRELRLQTQGCDALQSEVIWSQKWIAMEGLLRDIDAELAEYGQHLLTGIPDAAWDYLSMDGKRYGIPGVRVYVNDCEHIHIRRDWLDKIDREIPTTLEELEECLRLFKEKKLGGDVTIPFSLETSEWMLWENTLDGPFAPDPQEQLRMMERGENFEFQYGLVFRESRMDLLQRWYKDGLLNSEWAIWTGDEVQDAIGRGLVGCVSGGHWMLNGALKNAETADPTQDWVTIFPPLGLKGVPNSGRIVTGGAVDRGIVVCSWAKCPEALIALCDWQIATFDNHLLGRRGIEGKHWQWGENGGIVDLRSPAPNQEYTGAHSVGWTAERSVEMALLPPTPGNEPKDPEIVPRLIRNPHTRKVAHVPEPGEFPTMSFVDRWCPYIFTESSKYVDNLDTIRGEYAMQIIKGELPVVAGIKSFWDAWMAAGGEIRQREIVDQFNMWIAKHPEWKDPKASFDPSTWNTKASYPPRKQS